MQCLPQDEQKTKGLYQITTFKFLFSFRYKTDEKKRRIDTCLFSFCCQEKEKEKEFQMKRKGIRFNLHFNTIILYFGKYKKE